MCISKSRFGLLPDGRAAELFTLENANGMVVKITNYGGIIVSIVVPDKSGIQKDIVLGYDEFEPYIKNPTYFGAIIGRHANRIGGAAFELNGKTYELLKNDGKNHLHGGAKGFDKKLWEPEALEKDGQQILILKLFSADGEEGYPANLNVQVTYTLDGNNALTIDYKAESDQDTVVNLTNHTYFNLGGHDAGNINGHWLYLNARSYTPNDDACLPMGKICDVTNSPFDFTVLSSVGEGLKYADTCDQLAKCGGFDHNYVLNGSGKEIIRAAEVLEPASGRRLRVWTNKPGVQFYTGNSINDVKGKNGAVYGKRSGLCLETQYFPNSLKHENFPSPILKAGEPYHFITIYEFSNEP